jgi:hypothetical protein
MTKQELISMAKDTYRKLDNYGDDIKENHLYYKTNIDISNYSTSSK